ncbi:T-cell surface glycoprotein CD3 gamma chain-like [Alosa sapidissima]|uniref:T-cell surface glycoprotein CD3 gamma chain-like n=1 Tax=Alosa sapidissima TaxID=34773 RepID=UPI001C08E0E1|nr:T-cell surface glycoprotein CD3 gamma chain-like [Alosa sapidissima]
MRVIFFSLGVLLISTVKGEFSITPVTDGEGIKLTCKGGHKWISNKNGLQTEHNGTTLKLPYQDDSSGEYECFKAEDTDPENSLGSYHVKFRTCENCIELDAAALAGIIVGNVVASILIGVAVYFISTQSNGPSFPSNKASKESDRRNLISNDQTYQQLAPHGRDDYDVLHTRRR